METWRCFVAVDLTDDLRADLAAAVAAWRREPDAPDVRWTDAAVWHLTLAFLGSIPPSSVDDVGAILDRATERFQPFALATGGLGAFPSARRARVLWYGISDPHRSLRDVADAVRSALEPMAAALARESPFRAHVTLGRARAEHGIDASAWLRSHDAPAGRMSVDSVRLYRSHLGGQRPARYEVIREVVLRQEASVHG